MDGLILLRSQWDRIAAWAFIAGGAMLVIDSGRHAREAVFVVDSLSWLTSGGLGGLAAITIGCTLLLSAGFHDEWRKLDRIEETLRARSAEPDDLALPSRAAGGQWLRAESDRVLGWGLVVASAVWLAVGSRLVAGALYAPKQLAYMISGGLGAFLLLLAGASVLVGADTRDEVRKLGRIALALGTEDGPRSWESRSRLVRLLLGVGLVVGLVCLVIGWWQAADALLVGEALDGLVLATAGAGIATAVIGAETFRARRRLSLQARAVLAHVQAATAQPLPAAVFAHHGTPNVNGNSNGQEADGGWWTASGLRRFHLAGCPALASVGPNGRQPVPMGARDGHGGLEPCLLCDAED